MTGKSIGYYEVGEKLGTGGMGVVYRARDTKLERDVALKFLPPEWSRDEDAKRRFMQEARTASGLDHQNICTVYEIGETEDGQMFIVMPLYSGQTLKYRLTGEGLPLSEAVDIIKQLLEGLATAHETGIIHRDVKPANIMLTDRGQVKLLDFGIAKLGAGIGLTRTGSTLGTAVYMSPEQTKGTRIDKRADLWSAGVLFYEMLTGRRPFEADYEQAVIYGILNSQPEPPDQVNTDIPSGVSDVVMSLLAKDPNDRPSDASAAIRMLEGSAPGRSAATLGPAVVVEAAVPATGVPGLGPVRRWAIPFIGVVLLGLVVAFLVTNTELFVADETQAEIHTVAVLPFSNLRPDPETDFLGYALADQIIGSLAYVQNLQVRPSTSIRQYENRRVDARTIGDELSVDFVVAGNYLKEADQIRLTVEMVDANTNELVWREPIEIEYENAFKLQDLVSEKVLRKLEVTFSQKERGRMNVGVSSDPLAYEYYLRAVAYPTTIDGNRLGLDMIERSVEIDSMFAPAWNQLGFRLNQVAQFSLGGAAITERGSRALEKALSLNPDLLDALGNLSVASTDVGRAEQALELANRMLEINPQSALGHFARGYGLRYAGMMDESVYEMRTALRLDSTDTRFRSAGITFFQAHAYEDAMLAFGLDRGGAYSLSWVGITLLRLGRLDEGLPILKGVVERDPDDLSGIFATGILASFDGAYEEGIAAGRRWEAANIVDSEAGYYNAALYCMNHEIDDCLRILKQAIENGYYNYPGLKGDPFMDNARSDPRFDVLLERARVKHEAFKARFFPDS